MPKVSVIIPVYNGEKFIKDCIQSVLNQTRPADEIIVVDDGSVDNTCKLVQDISTNINIKIVKNEKNMGIGYTRAKGIEFVQGDYVAFISADDLMNENFLETMLSYAAAYPDSIFYSDFEIIDENGNKTGEARSPEFPSYEEFVQAVLNSARQNKMFTCYNTFGPSKLWKENNFDGTMMFGEDLEHLLRCVLIKKINFVHVPWILFKYRTHPNMVTQQRWNEIAANNRKTFDKINSLMGKPVL